MRSPVAPRSETFFHKGIMYHRCARCAKPMASSGEVTREGAATVWLHVPAFDGKDVRLHEWNHERIGLLCRECTVAALRFIEGHPPTNGTAMVRGELVCEMCGRGLLGGPRTEGAGLIRISRPEGLIPGEYRREYQYRQETIEPVCRHCCAEVRAELSHEVRKSIDNGALAH